ncbi:MAG: hypothetical protein ACD_73C00746G0001, partial [uncultured bacterium]
KTEMVSPFLLPEKKALLAKLAEGVFDSLGELQKGPDALRSGEELKKVEFDPEDEAQLKAIISVLMANKNAWEVLLNDNAQAKLQAAKLVQDTLSLEDRKIIMQDLARTALEEIVRLQQTAEAMALKGTIDKVIPWETARQEFYEYGEREVAVRDFELAILKVYPTIKPRQLAENLEAYRAFITKTYSYPEQWREDGFLNALDTFRQEKMAEIVASKHEKAVRAALNDDPIAVLLLAKERFLREFGATSLAVSAADAMIEAVRKLSQVKSDEKSYFEILGMAKDLGVYRGLDADEEYPEFYDTKGNAYLIRHSDQNPKELVVKLMQGKIDSGYWAHTLESANLGEIEAIRFIDQNGAPIQIDHMDFSFEKAGGAYHIKLAEAADAPITVESVVAALHLKPNETGTGWALPDGRKISLITVSGEGAAMEVYLRQNIDDIRNSSIRLTPSDLPGLVALPNVGKIKIEFYKEGDSAQDHDFYERSAAGFVQNLAKSDDSGTRNINQFEQIKGWMDTLGFDPQEGCSPFALFFAHRKTHQVFWIAYDQETKALSISLFDDNPGLKPLSLETLVKKLDPLQVSKIVIKDPKSGAESSIDVGAEKAKAAQASGGRGSRRLRETSLGGPQDTPAGATVKPDTTTKGPDDGTPKAFFDGSGASDLGAQTLAAVYEFPNMLAEGVRFLTDGSAALDGSD